MATHVGREGTLAVGANSVAEIRRFSIDARADVIDDTVMGDTARTFLVGMTSWTASVDVLWDETNTTGQGALTAGASVTLNAYPEGNTTGDVYLTGTALVTGRVVTTPYDGIVEMSVTLQGTGALTQSTVV